MQRLHLTLALFSIVALVLSCQHDNLETKQKPRTPKHERIEGAIEYTKFTSMDVDLGIIPHDKLLDAIREGERRVKQEKNRRSGPENIVNAKWRERGPSNRGGRTRGIYEDLRNPNRIWIGGVSGGIWRTENIRAADPQWQKLGIYFPSLSISSFAQDPNNPDIIYVGTGESYTGDVPGAGVFKSTDDGATWNQLQSTNNSSNITVNEIYVHTNSDVYVATSDGGLIRSRDGGDTFERVLGTSLAGASSNNFHDLYFNKTDNTFYTSNDNSIYKSTTGDRADWIGIGLGKPGFPTNVNRIEFTMCPSNPDVIYCIGAVGSFSSNTFVTINGGDDWTSRSEPAIFSGYGQAWYDLDIAADPFDCVRLIAGGVVLSESGFQGLTWRDIAEEVHVDHHNITFDEDQRDRIFFGNDGGIWYSENGGTTATDKSTGYVTTQFYACAIHPDAGSPYIMGGTQDNNTLIIEEDGLSPSRTAWGGDGVFCFIDQDNPQIQIVSSQNGNYGLSTNGGFSFGFGASVDGAFINRSDYDDTANILYGQVNQSGVSDIDFFRWDVISGINQNVDISNYNVQVSAVLADPNTDNRVYFGGQSGLVIRVNDAHTGLSKSGSIYADLPGNASVSSVYIDKLNPAHGMISLFNYGASLDNVFVTYNDGAEWTSIEGDLPDLPVRWCMFDPTDHDRAMIATDAGIWVTEDINGSDTHWVPNNPDNGMPYVRVDMLQMRESDKIVLAATYGRGLMTTDVFASPAAVIVAQDVAYEGQSLVIDGSFSVNAQSYEWNFGDNTTSNEATVFHTYSSPGTYTITLKVNGSVESTRTIAILPYLPSPYQENSPGYAGNFDVTPEHFAAITLNGTSFQRGVSNKPGKDGTFSGSSAWITGINDNLYQNNSHSYLYTPMFDLSEPGLYELKFWGKFALQNRNDGFQVEYSTNGGASWSQLGQRQIPYWYNYFNENLSDGAFPQGKSYFTNVQLNWTQYIQDVSFLAGIPTVSFRYVFRSDEAEPAQGIAIDNFEVTKYDGELKTIVTQFNAAYSADQEVTVNWTTGLEYQCKQFRLERSFNGLTFSEVANVNAKGVVTTFPQNYTYLDQSIRSLIFYRLRVINENAALNYNYEFYTDTIVVRRDVQPDIVHNVLTNPFKDKIYITFTSILNQQLTARLYDMSGKLVREDITVPNNISYVVDNLDLIPGVYMLSVQIGDDEPKAYKLLTLGGS